MKKDKAPLKIAVANRGEISLRILKTVQEMGFTGVALYAEDDRDMPFVRFAKESICLGKGELSETYLNQDKIVDLCRDAGVGAIHPGYGMLSEKASFSKAIEEAGLIFIGPTAQQMDQMGSKAQAKAWAAKLKIPTVPGYAGKEQGDELLFKEAKKIGFPLLIKASLGGGGRGMRKVEKAPAEAKEFYQLLARAKGEAMRAFSDDHLILERWVPKARHLEIQVVGDGKGGAVHLFERECSLQRRFQKIVEEAPACFVKESTLAKLRKDAVKLASHLKYRGAGTVEFMINEDNHEEYFFLEMNTRLQVEHPVTEQIAGVDLVRTQIEVALEGKLNLDQKNIEKTTKGHSIELRLNAEDPAQQFLPATGAIHYLKMPHRPGIRVDFGYAKGVQLSGRYDSLLGKIISTADTREGAHLKLIHYLQEFQLWGVVTNQDYLENILEHPDFAKGNMHTHFLQIHEGDLLKSRSKEYTQSTSRLFSGAPLPNEDFLIKGSKNPLEHLKALEAREMNRTKTKGKRSQNQLTAHIPGKVLTLEVKVGAAFKEGDLLATLEAMKMEHPLVAHSAGVVKSIFVQTGQVVDKDAPLMDFDQAT